MARRVSISSPVAAPPAESWLQRTGLRRTPVRVGVIELLLGSGRPMSVPQILSNLKGVDTVTVYRTLHTFVRKKFVHRVRGEDRTWLYAVSDGFAESKPIHQHPHFVCDDCGSVECLESSRIPERFVQSLAVSSEYRVDYPEVILHGVCPKCR